MLTTEERKSRLNRSALGVISPCSVMETIISFIRMSSPKNEKLQVSSNIVREG